MLYRLERGSVEHLLHDAHMAHCCTEAVLLRTPAVHDHMCPHDRLASSY